MKSGDNADKSRGLYLSQTLLAGPHRRVDDLEEELASPGVEDEDGAVDGLGGQVTLKGLKRKHEDYMTTDKRIYFVQENIVQGLK